MSVFAYGNSVKCMLEDNEDSFTCIKVGDYIVLMVADGNGHTKGMINTGALAISVMNDYLKHFIKDRTTLDDIYMQMDAAMFTVCRAYLAVNAIDEAYSNIYASMTVAIIDEISMNMVVASIGNSEIRLVRDGKITRLNRLFSEAYESFSRNEITETELYTHPKRAILTSAFGVFENAKVDIMKQQLIKEDILLLTTDGLYRCMSPEQVIELLASQNEIPKAVDKVLKEAEDAHCPDNCTLICAYIQDDNGVSIRENYRVGNAQKTEKKAEEITKEQVSTKDGNDMRDENIYDPYNGTYTPIRKNKNKRYLY